MTDPRSPHPDSDPAVDHDTRSDLEQAVASRADDVERGAAGDPDGDSPLEPSGTYNGVAGTGGVVKNQDETQQ